MEDKYVFIHIPKTAGTSLRALLVDTFSEDQVSPPFPVMPIDDFQASRLSSYKIIFGHISIHDVDRYFPDRKIVTFLREPIDRCLSVYGFFCKQIQHPLIPLNIIQGLNDPFEATSLARQQNLDVFFNTTHPHCMQNLNNRMVWQLGYMASFEQRGRCSVADVLENAKKTLERCSFVGFYEHLNDDIKSLCTTLNIAKDVLLPKLNITIERPRIDGILKNTRQKIKTLTKFDYSLYKFALKLRDYKE